MMRTTKAATVATNPLNLLGVPRWAVDIAVATDDYAAVRAMAEAGFRAISRYFHPDRGGDEEFYGQFAAAIEELRLRLQRRCAHVAMLVA